MVEKLVQMDLERAKVPATIFGLLSFRFYEFLATKIIRTFYNFCLLKIRPYDFRLFVVRLKIP